MTTSRDDPQPLVTLTNDEAGALWEFLDQGDVEWPEIEERGLADLYRRLKAFYVTDYQW